jgi:hypothetical protein
MRASRTPYIIRSDPKLLSGFPWPIILKPETEQIKLLTKYESVTKKVSLPVESVVQNACGLRENGFWTLTTSSCEGLCLPAPFRCRTLPDSQNCFNQRGYFPNWVLQRHCGSLTDFVSKNRSTHIAFSWRVTILKYHIIVSPRDQCGEYSIAKQNFLSRTFIFRKQL